MNETLLFQLINFRSKSVDILKKQFLKIENIKIMNKTERYVIYAKCVML